MKRSDRARAAYVRMTEWKSKHHGRYRLFYDADLALWVVFTSGLLGSCIGTGKTRQEALQTARAEVGGDRA